jgi:AraC-like DNA-binding protein
MHARSTNANDYQYTPGPVVAMAKEFDDGERIQPHTHRRAQLIHAIAGVMTVMTSRGAWVVPPRRAVWMPPGMRHAIRMAGHVSMRTLYIEPHAAEGQPPECCVVDVSPLLRELVLRAVTLPVDHAADGPEARILAVILDEIRVLPALPLHIPMPFDPRLLRICRALEADPAIGDPLDLWAQRAGASRRTLARLFVRETGLSFAQWRQQLRLLEALQRLASGMPVTTVALDLGYASPSAFSAMFRRSLGATPSGYFP